MCDVSAYFSSHSSPMPTIQIYTPKEHEIFRASGRILSACLDELARIVHPGMQTRELDVVAEAFIRDHGGEPTFLGYNGFPASICTSVNEECVHGIPGERVLREGDILSIDCGVTYQGLITDACVTVPVGTISKDACHLLNVTRDALDRAVEVLRAGSHVGDVSAAIEQVIRKGKCKPLRPLTGHGVGRELHQYPDIPNYGKPGTGPIFPAGAVVAIEPIVSLSAENVHETGDGWTLITADHSLSAHFEHTLLVQEEGCEVIV